MCFQAHMARARLRDRHQDNLRKKLEVLKAEQGVEEEEGEGEVEEGTASSAEEPEDKEKPEEEKADSEGEG